MPQETKSTGPGTSEESPSLQGLIASREDEAALIDALEKAFDYRGDVTLALSSGERVKGYIFDRRRGETLDTSILRLLPPDSEQRREIRFSQIERLEFSGKDTAHGKSFENWLKRYVDKKLKGERASIESEPLD